MRFYELVTNLLIPLQGISWLTKQLLPANKSSCNIVCFLLVSQLVSKLDVVVGG